MGNRESIIMAWLDGGFFIRRSAVVNLRALSHTTQLCLECIAKLSTTLLCTDRLASLKTINLAMARLFYALRLLLLSQLMNCVRPWTGALLETRSGFFTNFLPEWQARLKETGRDARIGERALTYSLATLCKSHSIWRTPSPTFGGRGREIFVPAL